jgi:DNA-binding MarR family transcriptional regulator
MSRDGRDDDRDPALEDSADRREAHTEPAVASRGGGTDPSSDHERVTPRDRDAVDPRESGPPRTRDRHDGFDDRPSRLREPIRWQQRTITLRSSEVGTLQTVGTFRVVAVTDLQEFVYQGNRSRLDTDVQALERQGLIRRHTHPSDRGGSQEFVSLTRDGQGVAKRYAHEGEQKFYQGWVKPKELAHDVALYRLYQREARRIERASGVVRRVVLDAELKGLVAADWNRPGRGSADDRLLNQEHLAAIARSYHLSVVDGTVQIPDLRIEYDNAAGDRAHVDVELATEHYNLSQVAGKARAGFTIYAPASRTERLTAALEERGIVVEILSF